MKRVAALGWLTALSAAVPSLFLACALVGAWYDPLAWDGGRWVPFGVGLLVLEFVLLHSGAFLVAMTRDDTDKRRSVLKLAGLVSFYGLMAWGFAESTQSYELLTIFALVTIGRLSTLMLGGEAGRAAIMARSVIGIVFYLLVAFASIAVPVPRMGITPAVLNDVYPGRGGGLWEQHPERALAGAALYFALMGFAEIGPLRRAALKANAAGSEPVA